MAADTLRESAVQRNDFEIGTSMNIFELSKDKGYNNYSSVAAREFGLLSASAGACNMKIIAKDWKTFDFT